MGRSAAEFIYTQAGSARQEHCHDNTNTNTNNGTFDTCSVLSRLACHTLGERPTHTHTHSARTHGACISYICKETKTGHTLFVLFTSTISRLRICLHPCRKYFALRLETSFLLLCAVLSLGCGRIYLRH
jgi:hypothetical protein